MRLHRVGRWFLAGLLLIALLDITFFFVLPCERLIPPLGPPTPAKLPAVAILFHDFNPTEDGVDQETERRLNHAIALYRRGQAQFLVVAGGNRPRGKLTGSRIMADYVGKAGIPTENIFIEASSLDSFSNLTGIAQIMATQGWGRIFLVSCPLHLWRLVAVANEHLAAGLVPYSYSLQTVEPPATRFAIWRAAHKNLLAWFASTLLPRSWYRDGVVWVRTHTTF